MLKLSNLTRIASQEVTAPTAQPPNSLPLVLPPGGGKQVFSDPVEPVVPFSSDPPSSATSRSRPFPFQQDLRRELEVQSK